jgi:hypothetical protein
MNEHTVFVRTDAGQQAVHDGNSELPRSVRTLLFSIDGRSTAGSYVALLPNFGNVHALLDFLHQAGYIAEKRPGRRRSGGAGESQFAESQLPAAGDTNTARRASSPGGVGGLLRKMFGRKTRLDGDALRFVSPDQAFAGSSLQAPPTHPGSASTMDTRQPSFSGGSSFYPTTTAVTELPPLQPEPEVLHFDFPAPDLTQDLTQKIASQFSQPLSEPERLQAARDLMADFLYAYLPAIAHDACLSINALQTREQMLGSLPDYSQLVSRTGEMGTAHLAQLHVTLGWA